MGEVYRAYDQRLARWVAIKHVLPDNADRPSARSRFRNEAWVAAQLSHPAIVPIFDIVEAPEGDWIVMELVPGPTLASLVEKGPLPLPLALAYGREIASGLAEAHDKGILHRDLKTDNIIITPSGRARILDFGLAKRLWKVEGEETVSEPGQVIGTCRAMSPEQARGLTLDPRSDLFSLGVLLYEMVTGESPFRGPTPLDTLTRVCTHRQPSPKERRPELPQGVSDLIEQLLEKPPELRPNSAAEVEARLLQLAAAATDLPASSSRAIPPPPVGPAGGFTATLVESVASPAMPTAEGSEALGMTPLPPIPPHPSMTMVREEPALHRSRRRLAYLGVAAALLVGASLALLPRLPTLGSKPPNGTATVPADPDALYRQGMALLERFDRKGNIDRSLADFERALELDPSSAPAYAGLARAYWLKYIEDRDPAFLDHGLAAGRRALEINPELAVARASLGFILTSQGKNEEAKRELTQARQLDPGGADAWRGFGEVALQQGQFAEAETDFKEAVKRRPEDRELYDLLGMLDLRLGRYGEAEAAFQKSVELAPDCSYSHRNLGVVYNSEGRLAEASREFQRALEIKPASSTYSNLGTVLFYQGLYPDAVAAYQKALESGGAHDYRLWANLGDAYRFTPDHAELAKRAYTRALQLSQKTFDAQPGNISLRGKRALYLVERGDRERALAEIDQVLPAAGGDVDTLFRAVLIYELGGRREAALGALEQALRAGYSVDTIEREPDLVKLRADPRYHSLLTARTGSRTAVSR